MSTQPGSQREVLSAHRVAVRATMPSAAAKQGRRFFFRFGNDIHVSSIPVTASTTSSVMERLIVNEVALLPLGSTSCSTGAACADRLDQERGGVHVL